MTDSENAETQVNIQRISLLPSLKALLMTFAAVFHLFARTYFATLPCTFFSFEEEILDNPGQYLFLCTC